MDQSRAHKLQILPCRSNVERVVAINAALLATLREADRRIFTANERLRHWPRHVLAPSDQPPFAFTGTIIRVMVDVSEATFEDLAAPEHEAHARLALATQ